MEWKRKLIYVLFFAVTLYLGLLFHSGALLGLALLEILVFVLSGIMLLYLTGKLSTGIYVDTPVAEPGNQMDVGITLKNDSFLPAVRVRGSMQTVNTLYGNPEIRETVGMAQERKESRLHLRMTGSHCGLILVEGRELLVRDYLGLWSRRLPLYGKEMIAVLPEEYEALVTLSNRVRDFQAESDAYDMTKGGDDPSEIFEIREYRDGDRLQRVHWKTTARVGGLMVKEFSEPLGKRVVLFLDMGYDEERGYGILDDYFAAGMALSRGLLAAGCDHFAAWYDRESQQVERMAIENEEDLYLWINRLFRSGPYPGEMDLEAAYRDIYRNETWVAGLRLTLTMELYRDEELVADLSSSPRSILESGELEL